MDLFVKKDSTVDVEIFVYEKNDNIFAAYDKLEIPSEVEVKSITFIFRKPCYQDTIDIFSKSTNKNIAPTTERPVTIDANSFNSAILYTLLKDWTIEDESHSKIPVSVANINALQPTVARAAVAGCLQKITI